MKYKEKEDLMSISFLNHICIILFSVCVYTIILRRLLVEIKLDIEHFH